MSLAAALHAFPYRANMTVDTGPGISTQMCLPKR